MDAGPIRTCIGCRSRRPQGELIRLSRRRDGVVTIGARTPGRGAYLCRNRACIEAGLDRGRLRRALGCDGLPEALRQELMRKELDGQAQGS